MSSLRAIIRGGAATLLAMSCTPSSRVGSPAAAVAPATDNPLFRASTLPYQAPPFDRLKDSHYRDALEEGMRRQQAEIAAIANQTAAPTFENTLVAMEHSGDLLTRSAKVFFALTQA